MSNPDVRTGLSPVGHFGGSQWNGSTMKCYIAAAEASGAIFIGDVVDLAGAADDTAVYPTVTKATAGATAPIFGVIVGFDPDPNALETLHRTALTAKYCYVCVDPTVIYQVQGDSAAVIGASDVGTNFNLIFTHAGNATTGLSGMELNSSSKGNDATYQVTLLGAVDDPKNDISTVNAKWLVMVNLHRLFASGVNAAGAALAGGVGV